MNLLSIIRPGPWTGAAVLLLLPDMAPVARAESDTARRPAVMADKDKEKEKGKEKDKEKPKPATPAKTADGVFLGIEAGDYSHWKMRSADGKEVSYFILRPDASVEKVVASPKKYVGKKCRITWKKSVEDIPEAGGKMEVDQILRVEWTK